VAKWADDHAWLWLAAFTVIYLACTVARSLAKPLWFDELFTFYISRAPGWKERLAMGFGDDCPPLFYGLTHACLRLFGENSLASRMPEIMGFWLMCVCLFLFVRRRCAAIYAFLAVLLAVRSLAYAYAYEARPYGLMLGMAGLSLWCWQSIAEGRRRTLALVFLTLSVAIAVNIHYLGAQIAVPLLAGEACRTLERRKIDWGVLSALALGLSPLSLMMPLAQRAFRTVFASAASPPVSWAPHVASLAIFYNDLVGPMVFSVVAGMAATALVYLLGGREPPLAESSAPKFPLHELAASIGYLLVPAMMLFATWLKIGVWYDRYGLTAVVGCVIPFAYFCAVLSRERFVMPCLLITSLFCMWVVPTVRSGVGVKTQWSNLRMSSLMYPKGDAFPTVVADKIWFLQMAHYSAPEVASRLVYLTDIANAARRPDLYKNDRNVFVCRSVLPGTVEDYRVFLSRNREFWLLYHNQSGLEWLPSQLWEDGWKLEYQGQDSDRILFRVRR
jgi:hypothetical protein